MCLNDSEENFREKIIEILEKCHNKEEQLKQKLFNVSLESLEKCESVHKSIDYII